MDKGVLFILCAWGVGGAERVTVVLANEFAARGWRVGIAVAQFENRDLLQGLCSDIRCLELSGKRFSRANVARLRKFVSDNGFHFLVNGWCLLYAHTRFLCQATEGLAIKVIALQHNIPTTNARIAKARNPVMRKLMQVVTAINLHLVYGKSDAYVLLSESFKRIFVEFAKISKPSKLHAIANPLTLPPVPPCPKENVLLYVGRLEETQKKFPASWTCGKCCMYSSLIGGWI